MLKPEIMQTVVPTIIGEIKTELISELKSVIKSAVIQAIEDAMRILGHTLAIFLNLSYRSSICSIRLLSFPFICSFSAFKLVILSFCLFIG
jgi:hypothetical protein